MGRGRAKAKQQKVARELKYSSHMHRPGRASTRAFGLSAFAGAGVDDLDDEDDDDNWAHSGG